MRNRINFYQHIGAMVTGLIIATISVWMSWQTTYFWEALVWQTIILNIIYLISKPNSLQDHATLSRYAFLALLPLILVLSWRVPIDLFFVYSIIWIACVPIYLPKSLNWWSLMVVCGSWYVVRLLLMDSSNALIQTLLEATFHVFALISAIATKESELANEKTQQLNRELLATQHLLSETSRDSERTRIARDLHDLLGHHLTALTINLQVAGRLSTGKTREKVDQCYALSKLLLSDVRESVSRLRDMPVVNLKELLEITVKDLPLLLVSLEIEEQLCLKDLNTADALLKLVQEAITNTLKHSNAQNAVISVSVKDEQIALSYSDDGDGCGDLTPGNGIIGMRERIERLNGSLEIDCHPNFILRAVAPFAS